MSSLFVSFRGTNLTVLFDYQRYCAGGATEMPTDEDADITAVIHFGDDIIDLIGSQAMDDLKIAVLEAIHRGD
jgi:hypothetical protein